MDFKVYNARPLQKLLVVAGFSVFAFLTLLAFVLGELYTTSQGIVLTIIILGSEALTATVLYIAIRFLACSLWVFDEFGIAQYKHNQKAWSVKWENIVWIKHYKLFDIYSLNLTFGPGFLGIEYLDEQNQTKRIDIAFSEYDAQRLSESRVHFKVQNI